MARYKRPNIPYNPPEVLVNSNRYELITEKGLAINPDIMDGEANYLIYAMNDLYLFAQGTAAGIVFGANSPDNQFKFPITNGANVISWTKVTESYYANESISTEKLKPECVDSKILAEGSVDNKHIVDGAIKDNNINENEISFAKIKNENNTSFQQFFNNQEDSSLTLSKINIPNAGIPGTKITNNTLPAAALVNNSLTRAQLSPIIQPLIGSIIDWAGNSAAVIPSGYIKANGPVLSKTTYADLYAVTGDVWGASTATTFTGPDLRGRSTFGIDGTSTGGRIVSGTVAIAGTGGEEKHKLLKPEMPIHTHTYSHSKAPNSYTTSEVGVYPFIPGNDTTGAEGGDQPHNNMPPYALVQKLVYTGVL